MLIETDRQLAELCASLRGQPAIFLDTEFVSESRYSPAIGTIQLAVPGTAALIDPLAVQDLTPLYALLADPTIEKVFHAATQDLQIFYRLAGHAVAPLFDTQVAAALLGYDEQISFGNLVERVTGKVLAKSHSYSQWLRRPLSQGQIDYALDDVRYLIPVYEHLVRELRVRGRLEWAREEFAKLEDEERCRPTEPSEAYLRIRGSERLRGRSLGTLQALAAWREDTACASNQPVGRIVPDNILVDLARHPRTSIKELQEMRGLQPQQISRYGQSLIDIAGQTAQAPAVRRRRTEGVPSTLEPTVDFMVLCLRVLTSELEISQGLVATRGDLTELVALGEQADIPLLRGWRRRAAGETLLAVLGGSATAHILPGSRQVHIDWHAEPEE